MSGQYDDPYESAKRWRDRYGLFDYLSPTKNHVDAQADILNAVRRSANLIVNGNLDETVAVDWNPESFGMPSEYRKSNTIYLSPEILEDGKLSRQQVIDILIGTTIIYSYMHRLPEKAKSALCRGVPFRISMAAMQLYQTFQNYIAKQLISNEYGGYKPFIDAYSSYYTGSPLDGTILGKLEKELVSSINYPLDASVRAIFDECKSSVFSTIDEVVRARAIVKAVRELMKSENSGEPDESECGGSSAPIDTYGVYNKHVLPMEGRSYPTDSKQFEVVHVIPESKPARYTKIKAALAPRIRALRNRLKFRADKRTILEHALRSGDVDEGSVYKLGFHQCGVSDDRIFEMPMVLSQPDVHVHLLIDESGSMGGKKIESAREMAITIAEALFDLPGVRLSIWGHSGQCRYHGKYTEQSAVARYVDVGNRDMARLGSIDAFGQNIDGAAIRECQKYMVRQSSDAAKLMVVLSDGVPAGNGYGGDPAVTHTKEAITEARQKKIEVISIGVGGFDGGEMYGAQFSVALKGADSLVPVSNVIVAAINRASMLKEV